MELNNYNSTIETLLHYGKEGFFAVEELYDAANSGTGPCHAGL